MADPDKLRELAGWYREFADNTDNPALRAFRLHAAEDLEQEADRQQRRLRPIPRIIRNTKVAARERTRA